ncbi:hypothetical protein [Arthrobacter ipis]|uniref:hypothetical protein n=1 Tax=Arthrobacter ipis TaxID=2716202 RepID=UPI001687BA40|nr:hypothetical protein [Arthrobacter ipis]
MDGIGASERALAVRAGAGTLLAAAFSGAAVPDANPYYGLPYDDDLDAAFPASFPEDPFPEALFADRPFDEDHFDDGVPSSAAGTAAKTGAWARPSRSRWSGASPQTAGTGSSAQQKPWCRCPTPWPRWIQGS